MNPLNLFRSGNDYIQIANVLKLTEAEVERIIHKLRADERTEKRRAESRRIRWIRTKANLDDIRRRNA